MGSPKYDLAAMKYLASVDCLVSEEKPCRDRLKILFSGPNQMARIRKFCKFVVSRLEPSDFWKTAEDMYCALTGEQPFAYDEYGLELRQDDLVAHGIDEIDGCWPTTFYVKLGVVLYDGRKVHVVSLHCLERKMIRADGSVLTPTWDDGWC